MSSYTIHNYNTHLLLKFKFMHKCLIVAVFFTNYSMLCCFIRPHRTYNVNGSFLLVRFSDYSVSHSLCVCLSAGNKCELCKNGPFDQVAIWGGGSGGNVVSAMQKQLTRSNCRLGMYIWCHLANKVEPLCVAAMSVPATTGSNTACSPITLRNLFLHRYFH